MLGYVQTESEVRADYIGLCGQLKRLLNPRHETLHPIEFGAFGLFRPPFDGELQFFPCVIPLRGDDFQRAPRLVPTDVKGLYKKARAGELKNFTGIDSPYEPP